MRIQTGDGDPRRTVTGGAQIAIGDSHGGGDAVGGDRGRDVAERNVRRDARRPQRAGDIELADESGDAEALL